MRLLFFSSMGGSPWGGSEELWAQAAHAAIAEGHEVAVSVFDFGTPVPQIAALERAEAKIILRPRRPSKLAELVGNRPWVKAVEAWKPRAVCVSQGSAYECVGRKSTRPFVKVAERLCAEGTRLVNVVQFNEPRDDLRGLTVRLTRKLMDLAACNGFVAARNIGEAAAALGGAVPRARVLRNPVNLADTSPLPWPTTPEYRFAMVARLHVDAKGQDMLLDALASRAWKREAWSLSLFGTGQDEQRLRDQAARVGLADRVHFRGQTGDLRRVWSEHQMLVLSSRAEGTPLAMVEAMLLGRPCVVTDVGGCADWVRDGEAGFLAEPTVAGIGAALDRAWNLRESWAEFGARARKKAEELHDPTPGRTLLGVMVGE